MARRDPMELLREKRERTAARREREPRTLELTQEEADYHVRACGYDTFEWREGHDPNPAFAWTLIAGSLQVSRPTRLGCVNALRRFLGSGPLHDMVVPVREVEPAEAQAWARGIVGDDPLTPRRIRELEAEAEALELQYGDPFGGNNVHPGEVPLIGEPERKRGALTCECGRFAGEFDVCPECGRTRTEVVKAFPPEAVAALERASRIRLAVADLNRQVERGSMATVSALPSVTDAPGVRLSAFASALALSRPNMIVSFLAAVAAAPAESDPDLYGRISPQGSASPNEVAVESLQDLAGVTLTLKAAEQAGLVQLVTEHGKQWRFAPTEKMRAAITGRVATVVDVVGRVEVPHVPLELPTEAKSGSQVVRASEVACGRRTTSTLAERRCVRPAGHTGDCHMEVV